MSDRIPATNDSKGVRPVGDERAASGDRVGTGPALKSDGIRPFGSAKPARANETSGTPSEPTPASTPASTPAPASSPTAESSTGQEPVRDGTYRTSKPRAQTETRPSPVPMPRGMSPPAVTRTIPEINTALAPRVSSGIELLDHLLDGGLPADGVIQVYGPSFLGKEQLVQTMFLRQMAQGRPAIMVLTHECVDEVRERLLAYEPAFQDYEEQGLAWFVDTCTRQFGGSEEFPNTRYAAHGDDLDGVRKAIAEIRGEIGNGRQHLLVIDSVSTLAVNTDAQVLFRYLQIVVGQSRLNGALTLLMLDQGMHQERHVAMLRHLSSGVLRLQGEPDKHQMLVEGLTEGENPGWIDYEFTDTEFLVTGSLAGGRIR